VTEDSSNNVFRVKGVVCSGTGKGRKHLSKKIYKKEIKKYFGFEPFAGTLNIKVSKSLYNMILERTKKEGTLLAKKSKEHGNVLALPCQIGSVKSLILFPERSIHKDVIEIAAPVELRKKLKLKDGDQVDVLI